MPVTEQIFSADEQPAVSDFVEAVFQQMKEAITELTFGTGEGRAKANNETITEYLIKWFPDLCKLRHLRQNQNHLHEISIHLSAPHLRHLLVFKFTV
jgi:hypothetical protein